MWAASDRICRKRLKAAWPHLVESLERHGHTRTHAAADANPGPQRHPGVDPGTSMSASGSGAIKPLHLEDPEAIASELSDSELTCLAGTGGTERLLGLPASPDLGSQQEQSQLIGCLEEETVMRIFVTDLLADTGPLSEESSVCIRTAMEPIELRTVMLAGVGVMNRLP